MRIKNNWKKGSLTVELSCIMSLILLVLIGLLYLTFFVHNRAWLTAAAYEATLAGSMEGVKEKGQVYETARQRSEELGNIGFFGAENLSVQTNAGETVQVAYDLDTIASFGELSWHLRAEGSAKIIRPVDWIWKMKAASEIVAGE